jgi:hypothetical protein
MDAVTMEDEPKTKVRKKSKGGSETARDKFLRLAPARMETALKKISLVGNLGGSGYDYQPAEVKQMIEALKAAVEEVETKFGNKRAGKRGGFSFR